MNTLIIGYKEHQAKLKEGAELLVDAHYWKLSADDNPEFAAENKKMAEDKEKKAYKMLKDCSVDEISQSVCSVVKKLDDMFLEYYPVKIDWKGVGEKHTKVVEYRKAIEKNHTEIWGRAFSLSQKIIKEHEKKANEQIKNNELRPEQPKGILAPFKTAKYKQELKSWQVKDDELSQRIDTLKNRHKITSRHIDLAKSTSIIKTREQNPELAKEVDSIENKKCTQRLAMKNIDRVNSRAGRGNFRKRCD